MNAMSPRVFFQFSATILFSGGGETVTGLRTVIMYWNPDHPSKSMRFMWRKPSVAFVKMRSVRASRCFGFAAVGFRGISVRRTDTRVHPDVVCVVHESITTLLKGIVANHSQLSGGHEDDL